MTAPSTAALVARLRAAGSVFAEDEADVLQSAATSPSGLEQMVARRLAGEPLEVVVGWAEFRGVRVLVDPGVFVPRARTAVLVDHGLELIGPGAVVVDLCCGTGAVGLAVVAVLPAYDLHAADLDPVAVACARRNVEPVGGQVHKGDLFAALPPGLLADVLVVNAPYVPSGEVDLLPREARDHEPRLSLDGGDDGVEIHRRVAEGAPARLSRRGVLLVETSARQAGLTSVVVRGGGLVPRVVHDEALGATVVIGTRGA